MFPASMARFWFSVVSVFGIGPEASGSGWFSHMNPIMTAPIRSSPIMVFLSI
jgi:hypothetical protein